MLGKDTKTLDETRELHRRADQLATAFKQAMEKAVFFQDVNGHSSFTARQVTGALRAVKSGRARGLDHWTPGNWLNLPIEARQRNRLHFE